MRQAPEKVDRDGSLPRREPGGTDVGGQLAASATERTQLDALVDSHLQALRDGDLEAVMSTMTDDIVYELIGGALSTVRGREAVRAHHLREFANAIHERDIPLRRLYGDGFAVDELIWEGRITGRVGLIAGNGRRVTHRILRIFEVRDGRIAHQSIYSDFASVSRQLA
jgi:uncharacterized protein